MAFNNGFLVLLLLFSVSLELMMVGAVDGKNELRACTEKFGTYKSMKECKNVCNEGCLQRRSTYPDWNAVCYQEAEGFFCYCNWICS
ncbi:hypothetical protein M5689_015394 [Euphorbia peplus]|nr:hypothetical protein M5689_015394 [Euphorbia peplus]